MTEIRVIHLSDIHFSEKDFWKGYIEQKSGGLHRNGHDPIILMALDRKLKSLSWDRIVISGDLARIGHQDSYTYVKTWLHGKLKAPSGQEIGLNLNEERCLVIPGNHDRYNGGSTQASLENYESFFPAIPGLKTVTTQINGISVNFHLYDSSYSDGGFAKGFIKPSYFLPFITNDQTLDIAVVHHHIAQAPEHKRHKALELLNVDEFLAFLLSEKINAVLFGHTHENFFENVSADLLKKQITFKRKYPKWLRNMLPKRWLAQNMVTLSYDRKPPTINGKYPSFDKYFEYLYIKNCLNQDISGPDNFKEPRDFYQYIKSYESDYADQINNLKKKKVAFSMSPSPCYCGEDKNGFNLLKFRWHNSEFLCSCDYYEWDGNDFILTAT